MGSFLSALLAFILNCSGVHIFREEKEGGCEPLVSCLIFLFAVFLLLWDLKLYPSSLRKLWRCGMLFLEFFLIMFCMELIMNDFWLPLDAAIAAFLPKVADFEKDILSQGGYEGEGILQCLREENAKVVASYLMSIFFLISVLHATRMVDLRLLSHRPCLCNIPPRPILIYNRIDIFDCGPKEFVDDVVLRVQRFKCRLMKSLFSPSVKVKSRSRGCKKRRRSSCPRPCGRSHNMEDMRQNLHRNDFDESRPKNKQRGQPPFEEEECDQDYEFDYMARARRRH